MCPLQAAPMESTELKPQIRDVFAAAGSARRGSGCRELMVRLSEGQYVLCRWTDGLYYLGKIKRVTWAPPGNGRARNGLSAGRAGAVLWPGCDVFWVDIPKADSPQPRESGSGPKENRAVLEWELTLHRSSRSVPAGERLQAELPRHV